MFIEVIPITSSIDDRGLTYFAPDRARRDFSVGSIVEIPLRNDLSYGVVARMDSEDPENENIRSIARVVCATPILAPYQIETTLALAKRYFVHAHIALSLFLPTGLLRSLEKKSFVALEAGKEKKSAIKPKRPRFFHCHTPSELAEKLDRFLSDEIPTAVVFPDDFSITGFLRERSDFETASIVLLDRLTDTQRYRRFVSAYNAEKNQIIWTRRLLYYNLSRYRRIVYVEDALCPSTMRYQHTYDNAEVLDHITASGGFETIILSTIPSIDSLYKGHEGTYEFTK